MAKNNFYSDNSDMMFHCENLDYKTLFSWLRESDKEAVSAKTWQEYRENWLQVLESLGEIAGDLVANNALAIEKKGISLKNGEVQFPDELQENIRVLLEFGIAGFAASAEYGGMAAPFVFEMVGCELLNRACPSTMLNVSWYGPIGHMIEEYGSDELKEAFIPRIASGECSGNMAMTEADAGSDLAALKAYCERQEDGTYKIYGSKRFITNGNSEISLVLVKTKKGAVGLDNLNLMVCPRTIDGKENIKISKIEEKLALHGSATCELQYDGSKGWLLGEEGQGYRYMLRLMNESRIGVGFQGLGLIEAVWRLATQYANERTTWGKPLAQHELIAERLMNMEVDLKAIRSLCYKAAFYRSMVYLGDRLLKDKDIPKAKQATIRKDLEGYNKKVRALTPLIKYWVGENSYLHAREALQIFGGYGYTKEYRAEWWLRESLIYSLYEGTSQIQALMYIKDVFKSMFANPRKFVDEWVSASYKRYVERDSLKRKLYTIKYHRLQATIAILYRLAKINFPASLPAKFEVDLLGMLRSIKDQVLELKNQQFAMLHSERLCDMKCQEVLLEALIEDVSKDNKLRWVAERFAHNALAKVLYSKSLIVTEEPVIERSLAKQLHERSTRPV